METDLLNITKFYFMLYCFGVKVLPALCSLCPLRYLNCLLHLGEKGSSDGEQEPRDRNQVNCCGAGGTRSAKVLWRRLQSLEGWQSCKVYLHTGFLLQLESWGWSWAGTTGCQTWPDSGGHLALCWSAFNGGEIKKTGWKEVFCVQYLITFVVRTALWLRPLSAYANPPQLILKSNIALSALAFFKHGP